MDKNKINGNPDENQTSLEQQIELQLNPSDEKMKEERMPEKGSSREDKEKPGNCGRKEDTRMLSVGEWMVTILFYLIPILNIVMMAVWAFSSKGNSHRRNLSRACLLWIIILLIAYVVAMAIAGFTIFDIFR